ncbi:MAG: hypothetical protein FJ267_02915 [Planctomycetes bacterium]|nr:hypothetical protein [Planctomycetota bacterium]
MNFTPDNIVELKKNQVFVFGSNEAGIHGAGAAKLAEKKFGAIMGVGYGLQGKSFAVPTKDKLIRTLSLGAIEFYINIFLLDATLFPDKEFLVTKIGCGLAGYSEAEIANLFKGKTIPKNITLPESFYRIIYENNARI